MYAQISNCRSVQPFASDIDLIIPKNVLDEPRFNRVTTFEAIEVSTFPLGWTPIHPSWVEVYLEGFRVVNQSTDFGLTNNRYDVVGNSVVFKRPISGNLKIICDTKLCPPHHTSQIVTIDNEQGARLLPSAKPPAGTIYAATFCEPIALSEPANGYVRTSDDRKSLVYIPNFGFKGNDSFSYLIRTERGQLSDPKCVYIKVG